MHSFILSTVLFFQLGLAEDAGNLTTIPPLPDLYEAGNFATCGDCHCIPASGESCPTPTPDNDFTSMVPSLKGLTLLDPPFELDCDPYTTEGCDTVPPLQEGEVCAYELRKIISGEEECPSQYRLHTTSNQEALENGWMVTHSGACGTCSNAQDLTVYMENLDLTAEGKRCAAIGIANENLGLRCYQNLGMTEACAAIWLYNSLYTGDVCRAICVGFTAAGNENNGDPPECKLARCLQCDEDEAGPLFKKFAGRTRRGSGMLSAIVRRCDELNDDVKQVDPCEFWKQGENTPSSEEPSAAPTMDESTSLPSSSPTMDENYSETPTPDDSGDDSSSSAVPGVVGGALWCFFISFAFSF